MSTPLPESGRKCRRPGCVGYAMIGMGVCAECDKPLPLADAARSLKTAAAVRGEAGVAVSTAKDALEAAEGALRVAEQAYRDAAATLVKSATLSEAE